MKKRILQIVLFAFLPLLLHAQEFRVIGYLPQYKISFIDKICIEYLTHLNIAFANPDSQGIIKTFKNDIKPAVERAHYYNVKALISLGGGHLLPEWKTAWTKYLQPSNRSYFISNIMSYVRENRLDGVDVDLEWKDVDKNYSGFILELRDSLHAAGKLITAALPGKHRYANISDEALHAFDFINLMAYDACGPWNPHRPGQHSSIEFASKCIAYWTEKQGMAPEKLSLGLPCYGYNFNDPSKVYGFYYRSMLERQLDYMNADQVGGMYYNGIPTIKSKTQMAFEKTGGVMMWELSQDAVDSLEEYSLLKAVYETVQVNRELTKENFSIRVYPNPHTHFVYIESNKAEEEAEINLFNQQGILILNKRQKLDVPVIHLETKDLKSGKYPLTVKIGNTVQTHTIIKS